MTKKRAAKKPKPVEAWAVVVEGKIWPAWTHERRGLARSAARDGLFDGFRIIPVIIKPR